MTFLVVTIILVLVLDVAVIFITKSTNVFNSEHSMFSRIWLSLLSQYNHASGHALSDMWLSAVIAVIKQRSLFYLLIINYNNYQDMIVIISIIL